MMKAVLIKGGKGPSSAMYVGELERPRPISGQVLIQVMAFGINRLDLIQRQSGYPLPPGTSEILGVECSGVVAQVGEGVTSLSVGDEVMGLAAGGCYAEYVAIPATNVILKPKGLSYIEGGAIMENWITAFQAVVHIGEIKKGSDVLFHAGASGVTVAAMQISHLFGANRIFTTVSSQDKVNFVQNNIRNGATHAINYKEHDFAKIIKEETNGKGVELVVDTIGGSYWERNIDVLAQDGHMVLLGLLGGAETPKPISLLPILYKRLHVQGSTLRSRSLEYQAELIDRFRSQVLHGFTELEGDGKPNFDIAIHKVFGLHAIKDAHDEMEENKNSGKIVVELL